MIQEDVCSDRKESWDSFLTIFKRKSDISCQDVFQCKQSVGCSWAKFHQCNQYFSIKEKVRKCFLSIWSLLLRVSQLWLLLTDMMEWDALQVWSTKRSLKTQHKRFTPGNLTRLLQRIPPVWPLDARSPVTAFCREFWQISHHDNDSQSASFSHGWCFQITLSTCLAPKGKVSS